MVFGSVGAFALLLVMILSVALQRQLLPGRPGCLWEATVIAP